MPKKCAVVGCSTNRYHFEHGIRFYHVPREDEDLKMRWLGAIGRSTEWKIPTVPIVCEKHFVHEEQLSARNLAPNVVPTLNLPSPEGEQLAQLSLKQVKSTKTSVKRKTKRTTKDRTIPEPEVVLVPTVVAVGDESCCRFCSDELKVTGRLNVASLRQSGLVRDAIWDLCWPSESLIAEDDGFSICNVCWLKMQEFDHFVRICHQQQETLQRISGKKPVKDELVQDQPSESELSHSETGILFTEPQISNPEDVEHTSELRVEQSNSELPSLEGLTIDEMLEVLDKIPVPRKKYNQLNEDEECWDCGKMFPNRSQKKEHRKTCPAIGTRHGEKITRSMATRCCVVTGCPASNQDFGTFLFSFPKAQKLRQQWIDALGKPESWIVPEPAFICWSHFDSRAIQQDESGFRRTADAVPSKYLNNGQLEYNSDYYCRFCARRLFSELMGNSIDEMNRSADGRKFLGLLLPEEESCELSKLACDECIRHIQLTMRFIRNCAKASRELDEIAKFRSERNLVSAKEEIKTELDEFGEVPLNESLHSEVKIEASSLEGDDFVDSDDDDDDDVPLAVQFKQELKENDFKCSYCSFSSKKRIQLSSHMKKHRDLLPPKDATTHENPKFSCTECEFVCDKLNQLASHKKKHKRVKRERPGTKGKTKCSISIEEGDLQDQQQSDSVDKPKSYSYASYSDGSDENTHTNDETDSVALHCSECSYTCTRPIQLASHKKKHTGYQHKRAEWEEKRKVKDIYECEFCDFKCKLRRQMAGHRASHSELIRQSKPSGKEREHMCSICGKILSTRGAFFVHMKYHNDQRDYPCNICGKKFYSKRDVTMHVESLHEKKVYECEICGVKCTWKNALSKHMRKHDSKSYKLECSYCGKRFMAANELRLHVWRHTGQQLSCDICGAGYRFNFLLTQHKIRAHGIEVEGVKLYNRFKKDKMSSGKRTSHKSNQVSHDSAPTESIPDATSSSEIHEQPTRQAPVEDTTSYPADAPTGNYPHLMVPSSHVAAPGLDPHIPVPFHPLGSVMGQTMPPEASQSNIFHQNY